MVTLPNVVHMTSVHQIDDGRIFFKECRTLAKAGFDVTLIGPSRVNRQIDHVRILGVPIGNGRLRRMTSTAWRVLLGALASGAEICHFHDPELIPIGVLLKLLGRRVIYDVHEDCPRDILTKAWIPAALRRPLAGAVALAEATAGRLFDGIVAATPTIAARFPSSKTITMANFPSCEEFPAVPKAPYSERPFQICYVGLLATPRGLFDMIDAAGQIQGGVPRCLLLAGRFSTATDEVQSRTRPGWRRTDFLGWLDRGRIVQLLGNVRAGLVVLHPNPCFVSAYPIKMFEYMAAALPVVASDFPLFREILDDGKCGLLIPPADPTAIARAIEWIFARPDEAQAMGQRGRHRIETLYTWETEHEKLVDVYRRLAFVGN